MNDSLGFRPGRKITLQYLCYCYIKKAPQYQGTLVSDLNSKIILRV